MLMTPAWLIRLYLAAAMTLTSRADEDEECAVDERRLEYRVGEGGTVINSTDSIFTPNDCWRECCILRNRGERCNAASFLVIEDKLVCLSLECDPFSNCHFEPSVGGVSAKIALFNMTVDFDDDKNSGLPSPNTNQTNGQKELSPEEMQQQVENYFKNDNEVNKWNVDKNTNRQEKVFTTTGPMKYYEETTSLFNSESTGESDTDQGVGSDTSNKKAGQEIPKPHLTHGNTGIYGPSEVNDFDYSSTPLIVIGAVVTVVFTLLVLIFIGRKISASERLKYRPLRDSFPASNSYHDMD